MDILAPIALPSSRAGKLVSDISLLIAPKSTRLLQRIIYMVVTGLPVANQS